MRDVRVRDGWWLAALLVALAAFAAFGCNGEAETDGTVEIMFTDAEPTPTPERTPTPTPSATPTPTATTVPDVCGVNPDPVPPSTIVVQEPNPKDEVGNPFHLRGWGSEIAKDNKGVIVAVIAADGNPLPISGESTSKPVRPESRAGRIAPGEVKVTDSTAPFATDILVPGVTSATPVCIWVFLATDEEGFPKSVLQVPVVVRP